LAACSPAAIARIATSAAPDGGRPASLDLKIALDNSVQNQTYNTPALATLVMLDAQLDWMLGNGGLEWAAGRSAESAATLYGWAEARDFASPFVADAAMRSNVVGTIDLDASIDANKVCSVLRSNGIVDTDAYRKLGRNQLRIGMFPSIDPADIEALTNSLDFVVAELR
jgi:phosphoserine aminotransferase